MAISIKLLKADAVCGMRVAVVVVMDAVPAWCTLLRMTMAVVFAVSNGIGNQCD
jgi:hypothetical protein